jgi:hypothetical protein
MENTIFKTHLLIDRKREVSGLIKIYNNEICCCHLIYEYDDSKKTCSITLTKKQQTSTSLIPSVLTGI